MEPNVKVRYVGDLQAELVFDFFEGFARGARAGRAGVDQLLGPGGNVSRHARCIDLRLKRRDDAPDRGGIERGRRGRCLHPLAQFLGLLQQPATMLVRILNEPASALARVLKAKADKEGGAA